MPLKPSSSLPRVLLVVPSPILVALEAYYLFLSPFGNFGLTEDPVQKTDLLDHAWVANVPGFVLFSDIFLSLTAPPKSSGQKDIGFEFLI
jgi:hypothetical protein